LFISGALTLPFHRLIATAFLGFFRPQLNVLASLGGDGCRRLRQRRVSSNPLNHPGCHRRSDRNPETD
jgi:hypothetical protein